ncbi:MAG TPA: hypothetical protein PLG90_03940 [Ignavibacteria bacterium]|nr:hypothetical protein [Ignavibacteria bacterium]
MLQNYLAFHITSESDKIKNFIINDIDDLNKSSLSKYIKDYVKYKINDDEYSFDELHLMIEDAVKLKFNYTIRPCWTIKRFIFGDKESVPSHLIISRLKLFQYYKYYPDTIEQYITDNNQLIVMSSHIEDLLHQINTVLLEKLEIKITTEKVKNFFIQIFKLKYSDEQQINLEASVDFSLVTNFLNDKGFNKYVEKLLEYENDFDNSEISLKDIIKVFTDRFNSVDVVTIDVENEKTELPVITEKEIISVDFDSDIKNFDDHKRDITGQVNDNSEIEIEKIDISLPVEVVNESSLEEERKRVKRLFKRDEIDAIRKKIFKNNKQEMFDTFDELEKIPDWISATKSLKSLFLKNNVDMYDLKVILFVDILNEYFRNKENIKI